MVELSSARPPRVWLACDFFLKYTAGLAEGLLRQGCEVTLLTRDHGGEFGGDPEAMHSFAAARLGAGGRQIELEGRIRDLASVVATARIRRECGRWAPDFVHFQDSLANDPRLALASGVPTRPYALTVHDPVPHPGDLVPPRWTKTMRRRFRGHASLIFVHSELLKEELLSLGGIGAPIEVVPHGVGALDMRPLPAEERLLFFGRISHYKGVDVLLDAMPLVWERLPKLTLTIAGDGASIEHPVLDDPRIVKRFGYISDDAVPGLFAESSCVVLPYRQASQSGVGSLAREYGRAVIASAIGGLPELVGPEWGLLVPPEDSDALAAAIVDVLATPGRAEAMGEAAAGSLGGSDWEGVASSTLAAYEMHLRRGGRHP